MLDAIITHILDILQQDPNTFAGGGAFASGWAGVTRPDKGLLAQSGFVNLYDGCYEPAGSGHRPAIYLGTREMEYEEVLEEQVLAAGHAEIRRLTVPLLVVAQAPTETAARGQRNQLCANVRQVLAKHVVESGYWFELRTGLSDSGLGMAHGWLNRQGTASTVEVTAGGLVPCTVRYAWTAGY